MKLGPSSFRYSISPSSLHPLFRRRPNGGIRETYVGRLKDSLGSHPRLSHHLSFAGLESLVKPKGGEPRKASLRSLHPLLTAWFLSTWNAARLCFAVFRISLVGSLLIPGSSEPDSISLRSRRSCLHHRHRSNKAPCHDR